MDGKIQLDQTSMQCIILKANGHWWCAASAHVNDSAEHACGSLLNKNHWKKKIIFFDHVHNANLMNETET